MSITKPFTFVSGTKARANEVNADFDTLYTQVNSNISAINTNANDIDNLESNKANINGSTSQVFKVADPVVAMDAVNKQSMMGAINNTINYIDGYTITKDSGSPEDTIIVSAGSCYDYTKTVVLAKDNSTTKQNTSQGASTTYYVYVIGSDSGTSTDILISSSAVTPALPEGYAKFRQIGYYTTGADGYINSIHNLSNSSTFNFSPDYSNATTVSYASGDTVGFDGWLAITGYWMNRETWASLFINGCLIMRQSSANDNGYSQPNHNSVFIEVSSTDVITWENYSASSLTIYAIPFKGGN